MLALVASCGGGGGSSTSPPPTTLAAVSPLFATNGAGWNDYVVGNVSTATDTACNAGTDTACFHGGEVLVVVATGKTSCTGLIATDDLGAFEWVCNGTANPVELISTGLANGKNLSDLIDFTTKGFKSNKVTVKANGVVWGVTPSTVWWTNPIVENNIGGSLTTASTLYLVTSNVVAIYNLDADKVALVIQPGLTLSGPGTNTDVVFSNRRYLWIEGAINASGDSSGVFLDLVRFSMLRKVAADHGTYGVHLNGASNNTLSGVTVGNNDIGVLLNGASNNNTLSGVTAGNNTVGVRLNAASNNNRLSGVTTANNTDHGVLLDGVSNNTLSDVTSSNNGNFGIFLSTASNNTLSSVTAGSNSVGVLLSVASNNTLLGVTAGNNANGGVQLVSASKNTLSSVTAGNNDIGVLLNGGSNNNTLEGVTASNNNYGVFLDVVSNNTFTGRLDIGNNSVSNCSVGGGTTPGLVDVTCANNGSSNATLTAGITLADSFVGKITSDTQNASDTNGTAAFPLVPAAFDWTRFDTAYRGWGIDGSAFPNNGQRGRWTTGAGRIWDWSVSTGDTGNSGSPALLGVLALPTGSNTLTHIWSGTPGTLDNVGCDAMVAGSVWNGSACATTFLRNAVDIRADAIGNDNTLCESSETCLHTPNIGSYQGHGNLVSAGTFTNGTLIGITLMKYATNGR